MNARRQAERSEALASETSPRDRHCEQARWQRSIHDDSKVFIRCLVASFALIESPNRLMSVPEQQRRAYCSFQQLTVVLIVVLRLHRTTGCRVERGRQRMRELLLKESPRTNRGWPVNHGCGATLVLGDFINPTRAERCVSA